MTGFLYMVDRCDVQRYAAAAQGYGSKRSAAAHLTNVPCRYMPKRQTGFNSVTGEWLVTTIYKMMFQPDIDVREGDRVTNVVLQDGTEISTNFEVDGGALKRRGRMATHKLVSLKEVV